MLLSANGLIILTPRELRLASLCEPIVTFILFEFSNLLVVIALKLEASPVFALKIVTEFSLCAEA